MADAEVELSGDVAVVTNRAVGTVRAGNAPVPPRGELRFQKQANGQWAIAGHRFVESR